MLLPRHLYHIQDDDKCHLADDEHFVVLGNLPEQGILFEHQAEGTLDRDEHYVEIDLPSAFVDITGVVF